MTNSNTEDVSHVAQPAIRVLLVDDHHLFLSGLKSLLQRQDDFLIVGEASDGLEGIRKTETLKPEVVLLDLDMPVMSGREALPRILEVAPDCAVIVLTVSEDSEDLAECMRAGARGYLLKNIRTEFLLTSLRKAATGDNVLSPEMTTKLVARLRQPEVAKNPELENLTPREKETLALLAKGASNKEIARKLDLAESTVKIHVQKILRKLNLHSRVQAAVFAVEQGLDRG